LLLPGRVVPLEALDNAAGIGPLERFIQRCRRARIPVVLQQLDLLGLRKVVVGEIAHDFRMVDSRTPLGDFACCQLSGGANSMNALGFVGSSTPAPGRAITPWGRSQVAPGEKWTPSRAIATGRIASSI
jgi:hypothetical protein